MVQVLARRLCGGLMETDNGGAVQATYNYGNDLISMNRASVNSYYHYDGLGSTRQLTNSAGAVAVTYTYDAFGNKIAGTGTSANVYGFTGEQQFNEADNLVFLRARYYDPKIGRFISRDPILAPMRNGDNFFWLLPYLARNPQTIHSYIYCGNNPVNLVDPKGENPISWIYHCIQCFRYIGKAMEVANKCRVEHPCDTQARWKCANKDPSFKKALTHCTKCGVGSWVTPGPTPRVSS